MQQTALRASPERTAWAVVWIAFAIFALLVVCVPLGVRYVLLYSMEGRPAVLRTIDGTAVVDNPAIGNEFAVTKDQTRSLGDGTVISLDDASRAVLHFYDGSSVYLMPGSRVSLERMAAPRFGLGVRPYTIWLRAVGGRLKVVTASPPQGRRLDFRVSCSLLDAEVAINTDGVYGVEIDANGADIFSNRGSAVVSANGKSVPLVASERATVELGRQPVGPIADARELVVNGDFSDGLDTGWKVYNDDGNDGATVAGTAVKVVDEGVPAVRFFRTGSERNHCETVLEQTLDRELPDPVSSLEVRANIKLTNQSLSGGGVLGSEFPLMIRLTYRDIYGSENTWVQGFYYENPLGNPTGSGLAWPKDTWQLFTSGNLLENLDPKPFRLVSLQVCASGWDYESMVSWISIGVK